MLGRPRLGFFRKAFSAEARRLYRTRVFVLLAIIGLPASASAYVPGDRWTTTASGSASSEGDPVTLTWSFARDGLSIPGEGSSNLIDFLDDLFNVTSGGTNFQTRPWFDLVEQSFARWTEVSGVNFIYEPNDSGSFSSATGALGVRGDIRIGGQNIDGSSGTLAYAFFPNNGDIVIDTSEASFYSNSANNYRALRNTLMHEIGHAFGLDHVESSNSALLMEPTINTSFDGPQLDDIRGAHGFYGDMFEKTNSGQGNNSYSLATSLGSLAAGASLAIGGDALGTQSVGASETDFVSIANTDDFDFYSFSITQPSMLSATLRPLGGTFNQGVEGGTQSSFNASARNNLLLTIFDQNGTTLLASANDGAAGEVDSLAGISLTSAGQYFLRISGASDSVQLYQLQLSAMATISSLAGDYNDDGVVDAADYVVWRRTLGLTGSDLAADGNGNGQIDSADYTVWRSNFGDSSSGGGSNVTTAGVPESSTLTMLLPSTILLISFRSSRAAGQDDAARRRSAAS